MTSTSRTSSSFVSVLDRKSENLTCSFSFVAKLLTLAVLDWNEDELCFAELLKSPLYDEVSVLCEAE